LCSVILRYSYAKETNLASRLIPLAWLDLYIYIYIYIYIFVTA
jgi:hypothetical protein